MKAVTSNVDYRVSFNDADKSYVIQRSTGGLFVQEGGKQSLPSGITLESITFVGGNVVFNPNSTALAGNIVLKNPNGGQKKITVSSAGRVKIS